ncbi:MAG: ion channel [Isosphaeraceae bacterium]
MRVLRRSAAGMFGLTLWLAFFGAPIAAHGRATAQLGAAAEKEAGKASGVLRTLEQVLPASDLFVGGTSLVFVVLVHGAAMRMVQLRCIRRAKVVALHPAVWRADLLLASAVFLMLVSHLVETGIWTSVLVWGHLVDSWRDAAYFAANTYTTLGYGTVVLADGWKMLCPIIAISGLFTFGWTGSVLVDVVGRISRLKELAEERSPPAPPVGRKPASEESGIVERG